MNLVSLWVVLQTCFGPVCWNKTTVYITSYPNMGTCQEQRFTQRTWRPEQMVCVPAWVQP
jgi:hypothetical protein